MTRTGSQIVGRRLGAAVSGTPVWARHPDTGAFCHMIAIRAQAGQAAEMKAWAAMDQTIRIARAESIIYPMTITRPATTRIEQGPRQVDMAHATAMAINPGGSMGGHPVRVCSEKGPLG